MSNYHIVQESMVGDSSIIGFTLVISHSKRDMPGIEQGPLGEYTSTLITELQEVRRKMEDNLNLFVNERQHQAFQMDEDLIFLFFK